MKITIEIKDGLTGYKFKDDNNKVTMFEDFSRVEQIRIVNSFANGYRLFIDFLKQEE